MYFLCEGRLFSCEGFCTRHHFEADGNQIGNSVLAYTDDERGTRSRVIFVTFRLCQLSEFGVTDTTVTSSCQLSFSVSRKTTAAQFRSALSV